MAVPSGSHYLQLEQVPLTFDPLDQTKGCFFDLTNFQMFCVQQGFTDVKVKGMKSSENCRITIPFRGPVKSIKFSGGTPRILSIQTRNTSVEFVNMAANDGQERSLPLKQHNSDVIGFYWIFRNEYVLIITSTTVELYQFNLKQFSFKLVKQFSMAVSWAIFSSPELYLVICGKGGNVLFPFYFRSGSSVPIVKLPKVEIDLGLSRDPRASLKERDVFVMTLYSTLYLAVIRSSPQGPGAGSEILLFHLPSEGNSRLMHILNVDIPGRCTLSVVDSLVVVHHQASKTSMMFDISFGGTVSGTVSRHHAVLAPLPIAQCSLTKSFSKGGGSPSIIGSTFATTTSPRNSPRLPRASPQVDRSSPLPHKRGERSDSLTVSGSEVEVITPELYSAKWIFFQPDTIIDAQHGVIWSIKVNLATVSNMMTEKCNLIQLLLMRAGGRDIIISFLRECLEPGRQANLAVLGTMFDQLNNAYRMTAVSDVTNKKFRISISQKDIYSQVLMPYSDRPDMFFSFMVAVVVEFIRSLNRYSISVEHYLFELVMNLLIENKCYYQLHQFLQYHVISDSKPLAMLLLSKELVYPPATQLAMDMFKRISTADSEIIDILLSRGQILSALRYVKVTDKVDTVSARRFLEAAANKDDKMLFYTVFKFFEERNMRLRRKADFPPDEKCQQYVDQYRKWFS